MRGDGKRTDGRRLRTVIRIAVCLIALLAFSGAAAERETYTDEQGLVYDASGYFASYGKTVVGYEGTAESVTIPADVGAVFFQSTYDYSPIESLSLQLIQRDTELAFYGRFPSLKTIIGPDNPDTNYYVKNGVLFGREYIDIYGYDVSAGVVKCPAGYTGSFTVPAGSWTIDPFCFCDCTGLTSVTMPDTVVYIGDSAFMNCSSLGTIGLSNTLRGINAETFSGCTGLQSLSIPESVDYIESGALDGVTCTIDVTRGSAAHKYFFTAGGAYAYTVDGHAPSAADGGTRDGFTYFVRKDGNATIVACSLDGDVVIPDRIAGVVVDNLEEQLFYGRYGITSVSIPATVTYFGSSVTDNDWDYVFSYCYQLTSIQVDPENPVFCSVDGVLYSKDRKTLISYPVSREGTVYYVPDGTKTLCCTSFASCRKLKELYLGDRDTWWYTYTFYNTGNLTVYYPVGGKAENCMNQAVKNGLSHEQDSSRNTFRAYDPSDLAEIALPDGLRTIETEAFSGVGAVRIVVPSSVKSIRNRAFSYCENLRVLELPGGTMSIAKDILQGCGEVTVVCPEGSDAEKWARENGLTVSIRP